MRIWIKLFKDNRLLKDTMFIDNGEDTRTHKVFSAVEKCCAEFDIPEPIWLDVNIRDFQRFARCRFYQDSFIEEMEFDYMDFHLIEED